MDDAAHGEPVASIEATYVLVYSCTDTEQLPRENLNAFANTNAIFNVWPFWRELVMNTTLRMRMESIVIPLFRL